jgi:predicted flap endonuclease-1-like 5' DNA nuclease/predicted  nucleic acid-binding Zn-ribbon protein
MMDPMLIATISLGVLTFLTSLLWFGARRGRKKARRLAGGLQNDLSAARQSVTMLRLGEREAAWAAAKAAQRLDRALIDLGKVNHDVGRLESDLDDLRTRLIAADRDLERVRTDYDDALTRVAVLEGDLDRSRLEVTETAERIPGLKQRLSAVIKERDHLSSAAQRSEQLQAELAALGRVHQELTAVREENAALRAEIDSPTAALQTEQAHIDRLQEELEELREQLVDERAAPRTAPTARDQATADRLMASEAARQELENQLTGLSAARSAEQRAAAERIASLERLHLEIAERDRRLAELEGGIAEMETERDTAVAAVALLEVELVDLRASHHAIEPATAESTPTVHEPSYAEWDRRTRESIADSVRRATGRLETEVEHLRVVVQEKEQRLRTALTKPAAPAVSPPIVTIRGIGPVIAGILADHGVTTIEQVAALTDSEIDRLAAVMPVYPGRIRSDDWVGQAKALLH